MLRRKMFFLAVVSVGSILASAGVTSADEYWKHYAANSVPWQTNQKIFSFKGNTYVAALSTIPSNIFNLYEYRLWKSPDGSNWTNVSVSSLTSASPPTKFEIYNNTVYMLGGQTILQSNDGSNWAVVDSTFTINFDRYETINSYGTYLYLARQDGHIYRTSANTTPLNWQFMAALPLPSTTDVGVSVSLFVFQGYLHAALWGINSRVCSLFRTTNGNQWEAVGFIAGGAPLSVSVTLVPFGNTLYCGESNLWVTKGDVVPYTWTKISEFDNQNPMPFIVGDTLHVASSFMPLQVLEADGTWQSAGSIIMPVGTRGDFRENWTAVLGNTTYVAPQDLWSLDLGMVSLRYAPVSAGAFSTGQKNGFVIGMSAQVNLSDMIQLTTKNIGTAISGQDISRLALVRYTGQNNGSFQELAEFSPSPSDNRTWTSASVQVHDGDNLAVVADIASNAQVGNTCQFSIDVNGVKSTDKPNFVLSAPIGPAQTFVINAAAGNSSIAIPEVEIYPSPSHGVVHFLYTLDSASDVTISIYDLNGALVQKIEDPGKAAAVQSTTNWDATAMATGVYYATIKITPSSGSKRLYKRKVFLQK